MSRSTLAGWAGFATGTTLLIVSIAFAQAPKPPVEAEIKIREKVKVPGEKTVRRVEKVEAHQHFLPHRSSEMVGMHIQSPRGADVGTVKDLVLDCSTGQVRYVVVAFGGFAGFGEKLFAVPWGVFECKASVGSHEHVFIVDVTEEQLAKAPTFTASSWPDFTQVTWYEKNDAYYQQHFKVRPGRGRADVDVNVAPGGVRIDKKPADRSDDQSPDQPRADQPKSNLPKEPKTNDKTDDAAPKSDNANPNAAEPKNPPRNDDDETAPKSKSPE